MICSVCGKPNNDDLFFCVKCGYRLERKLSAAARGSGSMTCSNCGTDNPSGMKFCGMCGRKLIEPARIVLFGEFHRGKNTILNALIGVGKVIPQDVLFSKIPITLKNCNDMFINIEYENGERKKTELFDLDKLDVCRYPEKNIACIDIYSPIDIFNDNAVLIKNPSINLMIEGINQWMVEEQYKDLLKEIELADIFVLALMATLPFSQSEYAMLEYVLNNTRKNGVKYLIFALTGLDLLEEEDQTKLMDYMDRRLTHDMDRILEANKPLDLIYKCTAFSASRAVEARRTGDSEMLRNSRFNEFEQTLRDMICKVCAHSYI